MKVVVVVVDSVSNAVFLFCLAVYSGCMIAEGGRCVCVRGFLKRGDVDQGCCI